MSRSGAVQSSDPRSKAQAASIGATIGPDGWWYRDGQRLTHNSVDSDVNAAGTGVGGLDEWGRPGFRIGGDIGGLWERNKKPIAIGLGTAVGTIGGSLIGMPQLGAMAGGALGNSLTGGGDPGAGGALAGAIGGYAGSKAGGYLNGGQGTGWGRDSTGKKVRINLPDIQPVGNGGPDLTGVGNANNDGTGSGSQWGAGGSGGGGSSGGNASGGGGGGGGWQDKIKQVIGGGGGGGGGGKSGLPGLSDIGDFVKDPTNLLGLALGFNAANLQKQSTDYAKGAYSSVNDAYNQNAPLRTAGRAGMLNPQLPDLSAMDAIRTQGNPFARTGGGQS